MVFLSKSLARVLLFEVCLFFAFSVFGMQEFSMQDCVPVKIEELQGCLWPEDCFAAQFGPNVCPKNGIAIEIGSAFTEKKSEAKCQNCLPKNWLQASGYKFNDIPSELFLYIFRFILEGKDFSRLISVNRKINKIGQEYIVKVDLGKYIKGPSLWDCFWYIFSKKTSASQDFEQIKAKVLEKIFRQDGKERYGGCALLVVADKSRATVMLNESLLDKKMDNINRGYSYNFAKLKELFYIMSHYGKRRIEKVGQEKKSKEEFFCRFFFSDLLSWLQRFEDSRNTPKRFNELLCGIVEGIRYCCGPECDYKLCFRMEKAFCCKKDLAYRFSDDVQPYEDESEDEFLDEFLDEL